MSAHDISGLVARRGFLKAATLLAASPVVYPLNALHAFAGEVVSVRDYGAKGDGISDDTRAVVDALSKNPTATVVVPLGTYLMRNPILIQNFSGRMQCELGARFVFTDGSQPGWTFMWGSGAVIQNFRCGWRQPGALRLSNSAGLLLDRTINTAVDGCVVDNSNGAGINCFYSVNPTITNSAVQNTLANGVIFLNCANGSAIDIKTTNTGDDGLEFFAAEGASNVSGGYARNISVTTSRARGIAVNGQSNVVINGFSINGTSSSGILCGKDSSWKSQVPRDVLFVNGTIQNAGTITSPNQGNQFGIEIIQVTSATVAAVTTIGSGSRGLSVYAPTGSVSLRDIRVQSPSKGDGANLLAQNLTIDRLRTENTPGSGIAIWGSGSVQGRRLETVNASQTLSLNRAIWIENNSHIALDMLNIVDTQAVPTGYIVGCYGSGQAGTIRGVTSDIPNYGPVRIETWSSPSVAITD